MPSVLAVIGPYSSTRSSSNFLIDIQHTLTYCLHHKFLIEYGHLHGIIICTALLHISCLLDGGSSCSPSIQKQGNLGNEV